MLRSSASHENIDLDPMAGDFIAQLRTECTNMPAINYLAQWANMSSSTLAYTYTYFTQSGSPTTTVTGSVWLPANQFEAYFNPALVGRKLPRLRPLRPQIDHAARSTARRGEQTPASYPTNYAAQQRRSRREERAVPRPVRRPRLRRQRPHIQPAGVRQRLQLQPRTQLDSCRTRRARATAAWTTTQRSF